MHQDEHYMRMALAKAAEGVAAGQSPFGAVIVREGQAISLAHNTVWATTDATAHAEVNAIRIACAALGTIDLAGCTIYSTCEPCPMCFSACHWARVTRIVYAAHIADAQSLGFHELAIANTDMQCLGGSRIQLSPGVLRDQAVRLMRDWLARGGQVY